MTQKILILGVTGMLGNTVFKLLSSDQQLQVWGTLRNSDFRHFFSQELNSRLVSLNVLDQDALIRVFEQLRPDIVINCIGIVKQVASAKDPLVTLPLNALLPHRLANLCSLAGSRLIHVSTDCVFSGQKGMYTESDVTDATDLYGKSKSLGELSTLSHVITLRTSYIGHELNSHVALLNWFLAQTGSVKGFSKAIFSGLPTIELARIMAKYVIPNPQLSGLYHVSGEPIDKFSLLKLIATTYGKSIEIIEDTQFCIDRSLDSTRFRTMTGYIPLLWQDLVHQMYKNDFSLDRKECV